MVEVGFGPGDGVRLAAETASDGFVAGVDYSELMVRKARERNAAAIEAGTVDLRYGRASELPFEADSFDKAFSINSMQLARRAGRTRGYNAFSPRPEGS